VHYIKQNTWIFVRTECSKSSFSSVSLSRTKLLQI